MMLWGFNTIDLAALGIFALCWVGHFWTVNRSPLRFRTITYRMNTMRIEWMRVLMRRDPKMFDALIQNQFQQGVLFFASTSILIVGAMLAGLGATDEVMEVLIDLPFSSPTTRTVWDMKILLVTFIFVFSFFKFAWSYNYVMIVAGAAPDPATRSDKAIEAYAQKLASLHSIAALHFTTGLNAYFFALASFAWFLNAWAFILATLWITGVLFRRAFASKFMRLLGKPADWFEGNQ